MQSISPAAGRNTRTSHPTQHTPKRVTLGTELPVRAYEFHGITIRPNAHSAAWRRMWWIVDIGTHGRNVRDALIRLAGRDPADEAYWTPTVSFPSLRDACAAIAEATEAA